MKSGVITAARLIEQNAQRGGFRGRVVFVTLTYRPDAQWAGSHVRDYLQRVRSWIERRGDTARYVWTIETTAAGVPHYHALVWLRRGLTLPFADKRGWWPHGMSNQVWARNAVGYIAKYASKGHAGKRVPKGARLFGFGGLRGAARRIWSWWRLPNRIRDEVGLDADVIRAKKGGGFVSKATGQRWPPIYGYSHRIVFPNVDSIVYLCPLHGQVARKGYDDWDSVDSLQREDEYERVQADPEACAVRARWQAQDYEDARLFS